MIEPSEHSPRFWSRDSAFIAALILLTLVVFGMCVRFHFTNWDDDVHITDNPLFHPPRIANIGFYWTHLFFGLYVPLSYTIWTLLGLLSMSPAMFHGANVCLHADCTVMVYLILRQLKFNDWPCVIGAAVFGVHPLQVESVAWVSAFRDLLSAFFLLTATWQYLRFIRKQNHAHYFAALFLCLLAILSKPSAVIAPALLGIVGMFADRSWRLLLRDLLPLLVLSIACVTWTSLAQPPTFLQPTPLWARPLVAGDALAFYLIKLVWPEHLAYDYGRTPQVILANHQIFFMWLIPAAAMLILLLWRERTLLTAAAIFVIGVLPVLGFVPFDFQDKSTVADRYVYVSMLGVAMAVARLNYRMIFAPIIVALAVVSMMILPNWHDSYSLAYRGLAVNPRSFGSMNRLALLAFDEDDAKQAEKWSRQSLEIRPTNISALLNLGRALGMQQRDREAIPYLQQAVHERPDMADAHASLAAACGMTGRVAESYEQCRIALRIDPNQPQALLMWPLLQRAMGQPATATSRP